MIYSIRCEWSERYIKQDILGLDVEIYKGNRKIETVSLNIPLLPKETIEEAKTKFISLFKLDNSLGQHNWVVRLYENRWLRQPLYKMEIKLYKDIISTSTYFRPEKSGFYVLEWTIENERTDKKEKMYKIIEKKDKKKLKEIKSSIQKFNDGDYNIKLFNDYCCKALGEDILENREFRKLGEWNE